ncbi:hypothetical protein DMN91_003143 [Ooceraea biroi]|uniref:Uncharacterized protein n=1 Tax=Ooceraea biroi TaxID=2015173 RepID=A0A3L8DX77_OOCBI|nr:hypothetical protein DMN91_003143 [Ooceraea biroi]
MAVRSLASPWLAAACVLLGISPFWQFLAEVGLRWTLGPSPPGLGTSAASHAFGFPDQTPGARPGRLEPLGCVCEHGLRGCLQCRNVGEVGGVRGGTVESITVVEVYVSPGLESRQYDGFLDRLGVIVQHPAACHCLRTSARSRAWGSAAGRLGRVLADGQPGLGCIC